MRILRPAALQPLAAPADFKYFKSAKKQIKPALRDNDLRRLCHWPGVGEAERRLKLAFNSQFLLIETEWSSSR